MNILVTTTSYPRYLGDGAGTFIHSMCCALVEAGHSVRVLACDDPLASDTWQSIVPVSRVRYIWPRRWATLGHAGALQADVRLRGFTYLLLPLYVLASVVAMLRHLRHNRCDVIFAQWIVPGGFIGALVSRIAGVPLVISAHGSDVHMVQHNWLARSAGRWAIRHAGAVVACSKDFADKLINIGARAGTTYAIPYGVDTNRFMPDESSVAAARGTFGGVGAGSVLLCMGRLVHKKGFDVAISALPAILREFPNTVLVIAGAGDLGSSLYDHAKALGVADSVEFVGHVRWQEVGRYLSSATVVLMPSIVDHAGNLDGLPNTLLEAMACGKPIVASRVAGIPDVISNGVNGILVPEKDPESLAAAVISLLRDPETRNRVANMARHTAVTELNWGLVASRLASVLEDAAEAKE